MDFCEFGTQGNIVLSTVKHQGYIQKWYKFTVLFPSNLNWILFWFVAGVPPGAQRVKKISLFSPGSHSKWQQPMQMSSGKKKLEGRQLQ